MSFLPKFVGRAVLSTAPGVGGLVGGAIGGHSGKNVGRAIGGGIKAVGHLFGLEQGGRVRRPPTAAFKYGGAVMSHRQPRRRKRVR